MSLDFYRLAQYEKLCGVINLLYANTFTDPTNYDLFQLRYLKDTHGRNTRSSGPASSAFIARKPISLTPILGICRC